MIDLSRCALVSLVASLACGSPSAGSDEGADMRTAWDAATSPPSDAGSRVPTSDAAEPMTDAAEPMLGDEPTTDAGDPMRRDPPAGELGPASVEAFPPGDRSLDRFCTYRSDEGYEFEAFLPGGVPLIRGLILGSIENPNRQEIARDFHFGGMDFDGDLIRGDGIAESFQAGLDGLADACGHPEIANGLFISTGYSASSGRGARLVEAMPERFLAYVPGGLEVAPRSDATSQVPWLTYYGGRDGSQPAKHLENVARLRSEGTGALYGIAPMWSIGHNIDRGINLLMAMYYQAIALRYPADGDPRLGLLRPRPWIHEEGWVGSIAGFDEHRVEGPNAPVPIAPAPEGVEGPDVWLMGGFMAHVWQSFVTDPRTPVRILDPAPQRSPPTEHDMVYVEAGARVDVRIGLASDRGPSTNVERLRLFSGGESLAQQEGPFEDEFIFEGLELRPGLQVLIARADYEGGEERISLPHAVHVVRSGCPPTDTRYQVVCVR